MTLHQSGIRAHGLMADHKLNGVLDADQSGIRAHGLMDDPEV